MESSSREMSIAFGRRGVPLKTICSRKCEMPFMLLSSYFEPVSTITKTVTAGLSFIGIVMTRKPFFNVVFLNCMYIVLSYDSLLQFSFQKVGEFRDGNSFLRTIVAMAKCYGRTCFFVHFFYRVKINGDAEWRSDFILTAITFAD